MSVKVIRVPESVGMVCNHICGCGPAEAAWRELLRLLRLHAADSWQPPGTDAESLLVNLLNGIGLFEHGTSVNGSWLTEQGEQVLAFLEEHGTGWDGATDKVFVTVDSEVWIGGNMDAAGKVEGA